MKNRESMLLFWTGRTRRGQWMTQLYFLNRCSLRQAHILPCEAWMTDSGLPWVALLITEHSCEVEDLRMCENARTARISTKQNCPKCIIFLSQTECRAAAQSEETLDLAGCQHSMLNLFYSDLCNQCHYKYYHNFIV